MIIICIIAIIVLVAILLYKAYIDLDDMRQLRIVQRVIPEYNQLFEHYKKYLDSDATCEEIKQLEKEELYKVSLQSTESITIKFDDEVYSINDENALRKFVFDKKDYLNFAGTWEDIVNLSAKELYDMLLQQTEELAIKFDGEVFLISNTKGLRRFFFEMGEYINYTEEWLISVYGDMNYDEQDNLYKENFEKVKQYMIERNEL